MENGTAVYFFEHFGKGSFAACAAALDRYGRIALRKQLVDLAKQGQITDVSVGQHAVCGVIMLAKGA